MEYQIWYRFHRLGMFCAVVIVTLHFWNANRDFHRGWPLYGLGACLFIYAALFLWIVVLKPVPLHTEKFSY